MFIKRDNCTTIKEVVERNVKMPVEEFCKESHHPHIHNLEECAKYIKDYISTRKNPNVIIVGDYDCDGDTSTAIMYWMFRGLGIVPQTRIPHRFSEGYGLSKKIVEGFPDGDTLMVTVDNGIASYDAIALAKEKGFSVVVTDHHLPPKDDKGNVILPPADMILDAHVYPEKSEFTDYCGAGIAYRLAEILLPKTNLTCLKVLASIGTVADVMPLVGANRTLVKEGLEAINKREVLPGLNELLKHLKLDDHIREDDYGFTIGPTFNASGRLYDNGAEKVVDVLKATQSEISTMTDNVENLVQINNVRKGIVRECMKNVNKKLGANPKREPIVLCDEGIGEGIIGIVAGQLTEKYKCPSIVFTKTEDVEILKGSGRSIPEIHLKNVLDQIKEYIVGYGGHAGAAGLSIKRADLGKFTEAFIKACGKLPEESEDVYFDLELSADLKAVAEELKKYAPYGEGNPKVLFHTRLDVTKGGYREIGDGSHFMLKYGSNTILGFGLVEKYEKLGKPKMVECLGHLSENWYNGNMSYKFELTDIIPL